jgi:hypothetical protein
VLERYAYLSGSVFLIITFGIQPYRVVLKNMNIFFIFLGGSGATTRRVPQGENTNLRCTMFDFYQTNSIGNGGCFNIAIGK